MPNSTDSLLGSSFRRAATSLAGSASPKCSVV
jgi:hypothetical protein